MWLGRHAILAALQNEVVGAQVATVLAAAGRMGGTVVVYGSQPLSKSYHIFNFVNRMCAAVVLKMILAIT